MKNAPKIYQIPTIDQQLTRAFGAIGTPSRTKFEAEQKAELDRILGRKHAKK